jgi:hypothetical protein
MREHPVLRHSSAIERSALADSVPKSNAIVNYCQSVEDVYTAEGFKRRSTTEKKSLKRHLEWTARVWFGGEGEAAISKETQLKGERGSISAIMQAVENILTIVNDDRPILS